MRPANERWLYNVTSYLIGWAHAQNDPCMSIWNRYLAVSILFVFKKKTKSTIVHSFWNFTQGMAIEWLEFHPFCANPLKLCIVIYFPCIYLYHILFKFCLPSRLDLLQAHMNTDLAIYITCTTPYHWRVWLPSSPKFFLCWHYSFHEIHSFWLHSLGISTGLMLWLILNGITLWFL